MGMSPVTYVCRISLMHTITHTHALITHAHHHTHMHSSHMHSLTHKEMMIEQGQLVEAKQLVEDCITGEL